MSRDRVSQLRSAWADSLWPQYLQEVVFMMRLNPLRMTLSLLGIFIGTVSLFGILAIERGARLELQNMFATSGARVLLARIVSIGDSVEIRSLRVADAQRIPQSGAIQSVLARVVTVKLVRTPFAERTATVVAADRDFLPLYRAPIVRGRNFLPDEIRTKEPVCLITEAAAQELFPSGNAVGSELYVGGRSVQVIGLVRWDENLSVRTLVSDPMLFLPPRWFSDDDSASFLEIRIAEQSSIASALQRVLAALSQGSETLAQRFDVRPIEDFFSERKKIHQRVAKSLLIVAAIGLLIGGIGVANLMLIAVSERTAEIGLKKALGARPVDIMTQFVFESGLLCAVGGGAAALVSIGIVGLMPHLAHQPVPLSLSTTTLISGVAIAIAIGVLSGAYPACHAARLSPADALRRF